METHAHHLHKAPGSNWSHYLFEFLMLFLAVFCGFLAENWREHIVEKTRDKQFVSSLLSDLRLDAAWFDVVNKSASQRIENLDSAIFFFSKFSATEDIRINNSVKEKAVSLVEFIKKAYQVG